MRPVALSNEMEDGAACDEYWNAIVLPCKVGAGLFRQLLADPGARGMKM